MFQPFLNPQEYFLKQKFSIIHQIVLGLVPLDLEQQLRVTRSEINSQSSDGRTALYWACSRSDLSKVLTLLKYGADGRITSSSKLNTLHATAHATRPESFEIVRALVNHFLEQHPNVNNAFLSYINAATVYGETPLMHAIWKKQTRSVKFLIDYNADINFISVHGTTALLWAIQYNHPQSIKMLLDLDVNVHHMDKDQQGLLHYAALVGDLKTLRIIAGANLTGFDIEHRDITGHTPLQAFDLDRYFYDDDFTKAESRRCFEEIFRNAGRPGNSEISEDGAELQGQRDGGRVLGEIDDTSEDEFFDVES